MWTEAKFSNELHQTDSEIPARENCLHIKFRCHSRVNLTISFAHCNHNQFNHNAPVLIKKKSQRKCSLAEICVAVFRFCFASAFVNCTCDCIHISRLKCVENIHTIKIKPVTISHYNTYHLIANLIVRLKLCEKRFKLHNHQILARYWYIFAINWRYNIVIFVLICFFHFVLIVTVTFQANSRHIWIVCVFSIMSRFFRVFCFFFFQWVEPRCDDGWRIVKCAKKKLVKKNTFEWSVGISIEWHRQMDNSKIE